MNEKTKNILKNLIPYIVMFSLFGIFYMNFRVVWIDGSSMYPTLKDRQIHLMKVSDNVERGDIVVVKSDVLDTVIIKRMIALPGDTIEISKNVIYVNGEAIEEPYIAEAMTTKDVSLYKLQEDEYFVCGDNRNHSTDSRHIGPITSKELMGRYLF